VNDEPYGIRMVLADPIDSPEDQWFGDPRATSDEDGHLEADDYWRHHPKEHL
jgi:hypothetical protein